MNHKLKVTLVNHSDTRGGASVVTFRLMNALRDQGIDARMLVIHKATDSQYVQLAASQNRARIPFLAEHADIFARNGLNRQNLFKISTGRFGLPLSRHPLIVEADVVMLNWVNQGMLSLSEILRIARTKPVVWTMHDQWNMTGVCHYTTSCRRWENGCLNCPLVGRGSLAADVYRAKNKIYDNANLHFVAVSRRLAEICRTSPLMANCDITVIPNALPVEKFPVRPEKSRLELGLPSNHSIVVMGAARLDDPVKNLPAAIEALNLIKTTRVTAAFYGDLRNPELLDLVAIPHVWMHRISDHSTLQSLMAHADVVLSSSLWETLPGTLVEGIASGACAVATDNGGQPDIVDDGLTGYLVDANPDNTITLPTRLANAIDRALKLPNDELARCERHEIMARRFSAGNVAARYINLIESILSSRR